MYVIKGLLGILVIVNVSIGEYLDYENCKFRKKLVDKLAEECNENVEEVKLAKITSMELHSAEDENKHKCSSCTLYIVLF